MFLLYLQPNPNKPEQEIFVTKTQSQLQNLGTDKIPYFETVSKHEIYKFFMLLSRGMRIIRHGQAQIVIIFFEHQLFVDHHL